MPKTEWGVKRLCLSCGARFYDLRRSPIVCPKCGAEHDPAALVRPKRSRNTEPKVAVVPLVAEAVDIVALDEENDIPQIEDDEDEEDELIEDASELGEDEDDMSEVIENLDDEKEP